MVEIYDPHYVPLDFLYFKWMTAVLVCFFSRFFLFPLVAFVSGFFRPNKKSSNSADAQKNGATFLSNFRVFP